MKFSIPIMLLAILLATSPLVAKNSQPQFNTIVVKHFSNAEGMNQSPEFIRFFSDSLRSWLEKVKIANQVVENEIPISNSAAADSLAIEGRFIGRDKEIYMVTVGKLNVEFGIYRISDHALVKSMTVKVLIPPSLSKNTRIWRQKLDLKLHVKFGKFLRASTCPAFHLRHKTPIPRPPLPHLRCLPQLRRQSLWP